MTYKIDIKEFECKEDKNKLIDKINSIPLKRNCTNCEHFIEGICIDCNKKVPEEVIEKTCPKYLEDRCPF